MQKALSGSLHTRQSMPDVLLASLSAANLCGFAADARLLIIVVVVVVVSEHAIKLGSITIIFVIP